MMNKLSKSVQAIILGVIAAFSSLLHLYLMKLLLIKMGFGSGLPPYDIYGCCRCLL